MAANSVVRSDYAGRIARLRASMSGHGCTGLLVSCRENVRYLVGFAGSSGWLVVTGDDIVLFTDSRYIEQATAQMPCGRSSLATRSLVDHAAEYAAQSGAGSFAFETDHLSYAEAKSLESMLHDRAASCLLMPLSGLVEALREVKDAPELEAITRAGMLADGAIAFARDAIRPGMTEAELAWQLERWLREHGSGPMPFDIIVASGPNAALPHAVPSGRALRPGEPVVIDLGASVDGYCSDITRTLFLWRLDVPFDVIYYSVLAAQRAGIARISSGMAGREADSLVRDMLGKAGLAAAFTHGLGHGVGLQIHERPAVNARSEGRLADGMVFTVEPGVYYPGQGGVRIEDTVVLSDGKARLLTHADKGDPVVAVRP